MEVLVLASLAAAEASPPSPCDLNCPLALVHNALGGAADEAALVAQGGCEAAAEEQQEGCICAALSRGWHDAARGALRSRLLRKAASPAVRAFAQATHDAAHAILARMHPKYPKHLKLIPALEWAQTEELVTVTIRHARYTRGEPLFVGVEASTLRLGDDELYYSAEGDEKPAFAETTLRWQHLLHRRDGCTDQETGCAQWAAQGACGEAPAVAGFPSFLERCPRSCGGCPAANGSAVYAAWASVPGGMLFEARKSRPDRWDRLLEAAHPSNRIAHLDGGRLPVGRLLGCVDSCCASKGCCGFEVPPPAPAADDAAESTPAPIAQLWSQSNRPPPQAEIESPREGEEGEGVCFEDCRLRCADALAATFAVS